MSPPRTGARRTRALSVTTAMARCRVFRYKRKPVSPLHLIAAVSDAVAELDQYDLSGWCRYT